MENNDKNREVINKTEWIKNQPIPCFRYGGREYFLLNDMIEVEIDGVLYRVKSIYSDNALMGDMLDALTMERISRIA